jgi:two-component system phosphate regulon response regulator PhoB
MPGERILVVDDEPDILSLLVYQLSREGYRISTAVDGRGAVSTALADRPDLIVLDLMLPGVDGYEVLRTLREDERTGDIPVLLLTARQEEEDRIRGFERGADDYVTKPFSPKELVLRVRALLRRTQAEPVDTHRRVSLGGVTVDRDAHRAFVGDREMDLTPLEFRLLEVLMERRGRVQSRRQLLQAVWDTNAAIETRTVDMHVARLRSKMGDAGDLIETVRGVGYRFRAGDG